MSINIDKQHSASCPDSFIPLLDNAHCQPFKRSHANKLSQHKTNFMLSYPQNMSCISASLRRWFN